MSAKLVEDEDEDDVKKMQFKVILLGDGAVGKTSICMRFAEDKFSQQYKQTVGCDFFIGKVELNCMYDTMSSYSFIWLAKLHVTLQLWDIGGQSIGSKMITNYIAGANVL